MKKVIKSNVLDFFKGGVVKAFVGAGFLLITAASCNQGGETAEENVVEDSPVTETEGLSENVGEDRFAQWDKNADQQLDLDEYGASLENEGLYEEYDSDGDEVFTENEFHNSYYDQWDVDSDGILDSEEYAAGNRSWEPEYGNNFEAWDINKDDKLDGMEFNEGMRETGIYNNLDADRDGVLNRNEYNEGQFNYRDADRSGYLSSDELDPTELYIPE